MAVVVLCASLVGAVRAESLGESEAQSSSASQSTPTTVTGAPAVAAASDAAPGLYGIADNVRGRLVYRMSPDEPVHTEMDFVWRSNGDNLLRIGTSGFQMYSASHNAAISCLSEADCQVQPGLDPMGPQIVPYLTTSYLVAQSVANASDVQGRPVEFGGRKAIEKSIEFTVGATDTFGLKRRGTFVIDVESGFPLQMEWTDNSQDPNTVTVEGLTINDPGVDKIFEDALKVAGPALATATGGEYRSVSLDEAASLLGGPVMKPGYIPADMKLTDVAYAKTATDFGTSTPMRDVVVLTYRQGMRSAYVRLARHDARSNHSPWASTSSARTGNSDTISDVVAGPFKGEKAHWVSDEHASHLWAETTNNLIVITGSVGQDDAKKMLASLG